MRSLIQLFGMSFEILANQQNSQEFFFLKGGGIFLSVLPCQFIQLYWKKTLVLISLHDLEVNVNSSCRDVTFPSAASEGVRGGNRRRPTGGVVTMAAVHVIPDHSIRQAFESLVHTV